MPTTPRLYQREGASAIERFGGRAILGDEPGLGKTLQALLHAVRNPHLRPIIVVCPASLKYNWQIECSKHFNLMADVLETTRPPKKGLTEHHPILIINYDILKFWLWWLKQTNPKLVIIDELHYCGNRGTQRSRFVKELCKDAASIVGLTGTLIVNRPAEAWFPLHIIKPKLFPNWHEYAVRFCAPKLRHWGWDYSGAKDTHILNQILVDNVMIRRLKSDVLSQLPAKQRVVLPLPIEDRKQYKKAETDFIAWLSDKSLSQAKRAAKAEKLSQLGHLKRLAGKLKLKYAIEWIDNFLQENDGKLVIFAVHKAIIKRLAKRYGKQCVVVDGSVTGRDRQRAVEKFQTDPRTRVFLGNVQAAGVGLTLTAASTVAFLELPWQPGAVMQAEDRCHRIGQAEQVLVYYLVAKDTIETKLCEMIQRKSKVIDSVLDGGESSNFNIHNQLLDSYWKETAT